MSGATVQKAFIPLPGGGTAVYTTGSSVAYYRHSDWLGSSRLATTPTAPTTVYAEADYAPYGEPYDTSGTLDLNFTGQNQDIVQSQNSGLYDFLFREYNPQHGRWISPDPAGMSAVSLTSPQSWNRYAYVGNMPLTGVDPLGLLGPWGDCVGCNPWIQAGYGATYYLDGMPVAGNMALALLGMGAAVSCGNGCDPVHIQYQTQDGGIQNIGWGFQSFGADGSSNWSFSLWNMGDLQTLPNAALAEMFGLQSGSDQGQTTGPTPLPHQQQCMDANIAAVNNASSLNVSATNVVGSFPRNGAWNFDFSVASTSTSSLSAGRYPSSVFNAITGIGPSLHVPGFGGSDPSTYGMTNRSFTFTTHIDSAYATWHTPVGAFLHWFIDVRDQGAHRKPC
jgi:RHS repeat-associated protein